MVKIHQYGSGKPVLFLHGWGFCHQVWSCLFEVWPKELKMISVDLPGHGETPTMDMTTFLTKLSPLLPDSFAVVGWSLGGLYAIAMCEAFEGRVLNFCGVSTSPLFIKQENWPGVDPSVLTRFYRRYHSDPLKTVRQFIDLQLSFQSNPSYWSYRPSLPSDAKRGLLLLENLDMRKTISDMRIPASFMLGYNDSIVPVELSHALSADCGIDDIVTIHRCAHMPFLSHTQLFITHLIERII